MWVTNLHVCTPGLGPPCPQGCGGDSLACLHTPGPRPPCLQGCLGNSPAVSAHRARANPADPGHAGPWSPERETAPVHTDQNYTRPGISQGPLPPATKAVTWGPAGCALIPSRAVNCEGGDEASPDLAAPAGGSGAPWGSRGGHFWTWCGRVPSQDSHQPLFLLFFSSSRAYLPLGPRALRFSRAPPQPEPGCTAPLACLPSCVEPGPGWDCGPTTKEVSDLAGCRVGYKRGRQSLVEERGAWVPPLPSLLLIGKMGLNHALKQESGPAGRRDYSGPPRLDPLGQMEAPHRPWCTLQRIKLNYG